MSEGRDKQDIAGIAGKLLRGRLARMSGVEGSSIGLVLVAFTGIGALAGWWLDGHFHTSYWLPVLAMVGVLAGFREMLATAQRLTRQEAERRTAKTAPTAEIGDRQQKVEGWAAADETPGAEPDSEKAGKSVTRVPPPPEPSYSRSKSDDKRKT